jgi:UDP-N-acetyl-D-mannosaminuronic acid dehydrogenase
MQPARVVAEIRAAARRFVSPTIACLGLSSGSEDDLLHSPAMRVASIIAREGLGQLVVVDPALSASPIPGVPLVGLDEALRRADIVVVLNEDPSFAAAPRELYARPSVIDTLGVLARPSA